VGYVHAIAHQFGGKYHTPHGLANAIMLPLVLKYSAPVITEKLARLAVRARVGEIGERDEELAQKFLDAVDALNHDLGIPTYLAALKEADIAALAEAACHEAHTGYPVPRYMSQAQCEELIRQVLPPQAAQAAPRPRAAAAEPVARKRAKRAAAAAGEVGSKVATQTATRLAAKVAAKVATKTSAARPRRKKPAA